MNAITDVPGVAVGHVTLIEGEGKLLPGKGPIRTGVTAILPRPRGNWDPVFAATFNQNGNGDMTGINWIKESGFLEGPILLTGTHSVGTVRDAAIQWQLTVGVLVQCNYGGDLRILGVPIRSEITDLRTCTVLPQPLSRPWSGSSVEEIQSNEVEVVI